MTMFDIQGVLVSLDLAEQFFCCDIDKCKGICCIEGDAGAPLAEGEDKKISEILPAIESDMSIQAREVVSRDGCSYIDEEGDRVTSIVNGANCAFTCYDKDGVCLCAIEKAYREGRIKFVKPISCSLYPLRITEYEKFTAVNYHKWKICKPAIVKGKKEGIRLYQFLKDPLIRRFGEDWYAELKLACETYLSET